MKNFAGKLTTLGAALFLLLGFFAFADSVNAQTKKKKTRKQTATRNVPQPVQPSIVPEVISTADQYQDQNQQLVTGNTETPTTETQTPTQTLTFDEKLDIISSRLNKMDSRMKTQNSSDDRQKRLLMNLDILTRAEQRAESLRKQLIELMEKENQIQTRLDTIEFDARPEMIERQTALTGSLRPEELREAKRKNLDAEKRNLTNLLTEIQNTRINLEANVQKANQMVEKLRAVLEKDIDDALNEQQKQQ